MKRALARILIIAADIINSLAVVAMPVKRALTPILVVLAGLADSLVFIARIIKGAMGFVFRARRSLGLLFMIAACIAGFLSIRGMLPFMAVFGTSMEPELHAGNLILLERVDAKDVEEGDIIVFTIPSAVREYYNYPQVVAHRVIKIRNTEAGLTFRTKGDNTGEDPFSVRPQDLLGQVSKQISYLGFPLLFFQSQQGLIFIVIALFMLAIYLYADEISHGRQKLHRGIFAPVIQENQYSSQHLEQRIESTEKEMERRVETTEKGMEQTQQALNSFATAMAEYAKHMQSHTSAIQGLSEASHELKRGAAEQNRVLARMLEHVETTTPQPEAPEETATPQVKEKQYPPGCFRSRPAMDKRGETSET
ncbi:signal peptidase I [Chloroflexota bacterium]